MGYTLQERIETIHIYGEVGKCIRSATLLLNERNLNRDVSHMYVHDLVTKNTPKLVQCELKPK